MNEIHPKTLEKANDAAIYTLYLYLSHKTDPAEDETLQAIGSLTRSKSGMTDAGYNRTEALRYIGTWKQAKAGCRFRKCKAFSVGLGNFFTVS